MTGPEHYRTAEKLLANDQYSAQDARRQQEIQMAQVHATLALAAATAQQPSAYRCDRTQWQTWEAAIR